LKFGVALWATFFVGINYYLKFDSPHQLNKIVNNEIIFVQSKKTDAQHTKSYVSNRAIADLRKKELIRTIF
jgi:hypothetical protein